MFSNCLFFVLNKMFKQKGWYRREYILIRKSDHGWWPHFLWSPVAPPEVQHYIPIEYKDPPSPPAIFKGRIKTGD